MSKREYENFTNQEQWKNYLKRLLYTDNKFLLRSLLVVYNNQTDDEKYCGRSINDNNRGFSKVDSEELSRIAKRLEEQGKISESDFWTVWSKMPKYWKQLMVHAKAKMKEQNKNIEDVQNAFCFIGNQMVFGWFVNG